MKSKYIHISILSLFSIVLSSCSFTPTFKEYEYGVKDTDEYKEVSGEGYYQPKEYKPLTYLNDKDETESFSSYLDVYRHKNRYISMNTTGISNILVIPVDFEDCTCLTINVKPSDYFANVENAFFGDSSATIYESVASYFDKSSYGKLKIKGKVVHDFFRSPYSVSALNQGDYKDQQQKIPDLYTQAIDWYTKKYGDISDFYINGNKSYGVPIYFVYTQPYAKTSESVFWAYTFLTGSLFSWSSYYTLNLDYRNKPDAHTLIHETGHLLSLRDYYATNGSKFGPTGRIDMMDYSIGDETAYSKMILNWVRPYVVTGNSTLTIKPLSESRDLILLSNDWNGSVLDEYLLIELFAPTNLNEYDSEIGNSSAILPSNPGIKVYHVDSRAAFFTYNTGRNDSVPQGYVGRDKLSKDNYRVGIAHNNAYEEKSEFTKPSLYHLLENHDRQTFKENQMATMETFWYKGDDFGVSCFKDFTFNNGAKLGYTFTVDSLNSEAATITFTKVS